VEFLQNQQKKDITAVSGIKLFAKVYSEVNMKNNLQKKLLSLEFLAGLKDAGIFNAQTARTLITAHMKSDASHEYEQLKTAIAISQMFSSPFTKPDESVDGPIRFALTEHNMPIGIYPEECHTMISGQTGTGKSVLLKIIFAQALLSNKDTENAQ